MYKTEWDISGLKVESEQKEIEKSVNTFVKKWKTNADAFKNPSILKQLLDEYEFILNKYGSGGKTFYSLWLQTAQDTQNVKALAEYNKAQEHTITVMSNRLTFVHLNIGKIPQETQSLMLSSPELSKYKHVLEQIFEQSRHHKSEAEEQILQLTSPTRYSNWISFIEKVLSKEEHDVLLPNGKTDKKTFTEIQTLISDTDVKVRKSAANAMNEILAKHVDSAEAEMNSILQNKKIEDEIRGYARPDAQTHLNDDIPSKAVDSLIQAVSEKFEVAHRFYTFKAKLLKLPKITYAERNLSIQSKTKEYSFDESVNIVKDTFNKLDPEFAKIFLQFLKNGQVDVFPRKGKSSGAFCVHWSPSMPIYVLLNHTNKIRDVTTIAHEFGHAIHYTFSSKYQNALTYDNPVSTAEVASTFMEDFVVENLMKNADEETRLAFQVERLQDDISTIFRQIACYKFEQDLHSNFREKGYLSYEEIGKLFIKNMSAYLGKSVDMSGAENWWIYWSHIRRYFYVYSYASGLMISKVLQSQVRANPKRIDAVKAFLSSGSSKSPRDIFLPFGIDINKKETWIASIKEIEKALSDVEKLAKRLNKI